jgi:hypothetical protein
MGSTSVCRLGLADLFLELQQIILETPIEIIEEPETNGAAVIREALDAKFRAGLDWKQSKAGGIDWVKRIRYNASILARLGVEIQVSARSDLVIRDLIHLRNSLQKSEIDVGVIVLPSDRFQKFLTDRTPALRDAIRYIEEEFKEAVNFPIILIGIEHDKAGKVLAKRITNKGHGGNPPP